MWNQLARINKLSLRKGLEDTKLRDSRGATKSNILHVIDNC